MRCLTRQIFFEELNESAKEDIYRDIRHEIGEDLKLEMGNEEDWKAKLQANYSLDDENEVETFLDKLVEARIIQKFDGRIFY